MSIRNHETKRCTKIAPFVPKSTLASYARLSSNRKLYNIGAAPHTRKGAHTIGQWQHVPEESPKTEKDSSIDAVKHAAKCPPDSNIATKTKVTSLQLYGSSSNAHKTKVGKVTLGGTKQTATTSVRKQSTPITAVSNEVHKCVERKVNDTNKAQTRTKSPETVQELDRRCDAGSDTDDTIRHESKLVRPKSARPESRIMRTIEHIEDDGDIDDGDQSRPPTSRGRWQSLDNAYSGHSQHESRGTRDGSSLDNAIKYVNNNVYMPTSSERHTRDDAISIAHKPTETPNTTNRASGVGVAKSPVTEYRFPFELSHEEQVKLWKARTLLDLNSGVDDINTYLDIDPVLYFMADDSYMPEQAIKKPSLSKDAINIIGNTKSSNRSKPICFHGNNRNKRTNTAETHGSYHRNGDSVLLLNSDIEHNRGILYHGRHKIPVDDTTVNFKCVASAGGRVKPQTMPSNQPYTAGNVAKSKFRIPTYKHAANDPMATAGSLFRPSPGGSLDRQDDTALRKPRKLQPIVTPIYRHS